MRTNTIDHYDVVIDSRDVIKRIEELQSDDRRTDEETAELRALEALQSDTEGRCGDWRYGAQLIRDSYFATFAQELAEDIGAIPRGAGWPCTCIDWEQAARELRMDYTAVDFSGVTYWVR